MRTADGYIISKCLNGDSAAFGLLVDKYKGSVYALAYSKLRNFHDAEDVTQEVFIKAYRKLRTLKQYDSFHAWLYAATYNLCKDWLKALSRRPDNQFIEDKDPETLEAPSIDSYRENLFHESLYESLQEALDSMPETHSQVLTLRYLGGMSCREIARFLGVSPTAIWQRLSRARAQLKEEMIAMINTNFERQKLQASFTLRIVDAIKRIRIQPVPRTATLPWGLSLATGIVFTILSFSPQPNMFSRAAIATGSILHDENRVVKTGETPVDIVGIYQVSAPAGEQGDNTGEPELPDSEIATFAAANGEEGPSAQGSTSDNEVIIDPETGVKYTKTRTLTGEKDVIKHNKDLNLSPNGKFLLWGKLVIPLDDREPFDLVDMPAQRGFWSPDGEKVVFFSGGATWMVPVSPETGQATGPAEKLHDADGQESNWSPDSEKVAFARIDKEFIGDIWAVSVRDGTMIRVTDDPLYERAPVWSPDGKTIAYSKAFSSLWLYPAEGGTHRKILDDGRRVRPFAWSPDCKWLLCSDWDRKLWLLRLADGFESNIIPPQEVGKILSWSSDGKRMLFYLPSYDYMSTLKAIPTSGGPSFELKKQLTLSPYIQFWSSDSKMIITEGETKDGDRVFWVIPFAGGEPVLLKLDLSVPGLPNPISLSPDCRKLLFSIKRSDKKEDLWVVPISLKGGQTTGSAVMVFSGSDAEPDTAGSAWSPDGTKLAIVHKWHIWIASAEGGEPVQITKTPEGGNYWPVWSPDGEMIAYEHYYSASKAVLNAIPASGGEVKKILDVPDEYAHKYTWSPDGKELAVFSKGVISAIPIAGGKPREILNTKDLAIERVNPFLRWSPDGRNLAFIGWKDRYKIFIVPAEGGEATELSPGDIGEPPVYLYWSPDGKWISYNSDGFAKTRPEGEIWEADFQELLNSSSP